MPKSKIAKEDKDDEGTGSQSQNAFQMMMDARKISIGSNVDGVEIELVEDAEKVKIREEKIKRKLKLTRWNSEKGGAEKSEAENRREEHVKLKLEKRAKNFKRLIQNGKKASPVPKNYLSRNNSEHEKFQIRNNSVSSLEKHEPTSESNKFLQLLSPTIRKSESVLCYFNRVEQSPENVPETNSSLIKVKITPKTKKRHKSKSIHKKLIDKEVPNTGISQIETPIVDCAIEDSKEFASEINGTHSFRRSTRIAKKIVCTTPDISSGDDSEFGTFPQKKKIKITKKLNSDRDREKIIKENNKKKNALLETESDCDIILIEDKSNKKKLLKGKVKLAPLFVKKKSIDPAEAEAKQKFLQSGIPQSVKKQFEKIVSSSCESDTFPQTVHIQQKPISDSDFNVWDLPLNNPISDLTSLDNDTFCELESTAFIKLSQDNCKNFSDEECWVNYLFKQSNLSVKECLTNIKSKYPKFPVNKMYKKLKQKLKKCHEDANADDLFSSPTWIDKYKPQLSCDIIGNFKSVQNIKKWLELWLEYCESKKNFAKNRRYSNDSLCDFYSSDSESRDSTKAPSKVLVVIGPKSSGKTSAVYAIANELNIEVLEANISSKRSSKRINELGGLNSVNICKSGNNSLFQISKSNSQDLATKKKMILMLIDDADLVFDEDDGFASALTNLIQSANRPMVIVASDHKCNHLQQFMKENNVFLFKTVSGDLIGPWLDILLYLETGKIVPSLCNHLLNSNKCDIRSTILQLELCVSGSERKNQLINDQTFSDIDVEIDEETIYSENGSEIRNLSSSKDDNNSSIINKIYLQSNYATLTDKLYCKLNYCTMKSVPKNNICQLTNILENLSCLDLMQYYTEISVVDNNQLLKLPWKSRIMDSLSLNENYSQFKRTLTSLDWSEFLINCIEKEMLSLGSDSNISHTEVYRFWNERQRESQFFQGVYNEFSETFHPSCLLNRRAVALDYLPTIRNIFETEQKRSTHSFKRNNRFHNYLNNLGVETKNTVIEKGYKYFGFEL